MQETVREQVCQNCGNPMDNGAAFCPNCGSRQALHTAAMPLSGRAAAAVPHPTICSFCGEGLQPNSTTCWNCGRPVVGAFPRAEAAVPPVTAAADTFWRYPLLRIFQLILRVAAVLIILLGIGAAVASVVLGVGQFASAEFALSYSDSLVVILNILAAVFSISAALLISLPILLLAELIQMLLDMESNQRNQVNLLLILANRFREY